jgi:hypothetical protein
MFARLIIFIVAHIMLIGSSLAVSKIAESGQERMAMSDVSNF